MKKQMMGTFALAVAVSAVFVLKANAADIFVRPAGGSNMSSDQLGQITDMVRHAVHQMPENNLVKNEDQADFVLQPSVLRRGDQTVLRIEKDKDGDVVSQSEEPLGTMGTARDSAVAATESALSSDRIASGTDQFYPDRSSSSATTQSGMDDDSDLNPPATQPMQGQDPAKSDTAINTTGTATDTVSGSSPAPDNMAAAPLSSTRSNDRDYGNGILVGGDVRAPSPGIHRRDNNGTIEVGLGPSFGVGMGSDEPLYDLTAAYAIPFTTQISGKVLTDLNFAAGADPNQFLNFGLGADIFPSEGLTVGGAKPYVDGDVGFAFTRNKDRVIDNAPAIGGGAGFKFAAQDLNFDVNMHYTILLSQVEGSTPSVLGLRAAMNF